MQLQGIKTETRALKKSIIHDHESQPLMGSLIATAVIIQQCTTLDLH